MRYTSDGCTLFPDLWIHSCCVAHDLADDMGVKDSIADAEFLQCIADQTGFGVVGWIFGCLVVGGMMVGRPLWRKYRGGEND